MKIAIRADGGPERGYGHLVRTGALAKECLQRGDDVLYFTQTPTAVREELPSTVTSVRLDGQNEIEEVIQYIEDYSVDAIFTDSFKIDTIYQERLSKTRATLAVRHNFKHYTVCCDVLIYGDLHAPYLEYDWIGTKPEFCLGPDYILLREQFRQAAQKEKIWRDDPKRVLIVMGGSDVNNATPRIMETFENFDGTIDVVIGPGFENEREIKRTAQAMRSDFNLLFNPENMAEILYRADFAVSAVGGTIFELLATQTPFIGIPQVDNQKQRAAALQRRDLGLIVSNTDALSKHVDTLHFSELRRKLYDNIDGIVDGCGAKRVYESLRNGSNFSD